MKLRFAVAVSNRTLSILSLIVCLVCASLIATPGLCADEPASAPMAPEAIYEGEQSEGGLLKGVLWYVPNRIYDFFDMFSLSLSAGPVAGWNFRATEDMTFGVTEMNAHRVGFMPKTNDHKRLSVSRFLDMGLEKDGLNYMANRQTFGYERVYEAEYGARFFKKQWGDIYRPKWEVGFDLHLILGIRAALDVSEICDFLLGFGLYDHKHDDHSPRVWPKY